MRTFVYIVFNDFFYFLFFVWLRICADSYALFGLVPSRNANFHPARVLSSFIPASFCSRRRRDVTCGYVTHLFGGIASLGFIYVGQNAAPGSVIIGLMTGYCVPPSQMYVH